MQSTSEENYLKVIYAIVKGGAGLASTNEIAERIHTKASSVTDMLQKLSEKGLVNYKKYKGSSLTPEGENHALKIIRKHRLWEVFLHEKLKFGWDEVHVIAEQLEHVKSPELTDRLDSFLGFPKTDPHGDPIPDGKGKFEKITGKSRLSELHTGTKGVIIGVDDTSSELLKFLEDQELTLGVDFEILQVVDYDQSYQLCINQKKEITLSNIIAKNLWVKTNNSHGNN